jgi:uncharacterized protein involved in response to NO
MIYRITGLSAMLRVIDVPSISEKGCAITIRADNAFRFLWAEKLYQGYSMSEQKEHPAAPAKLRRARFGECLEEPYRIFFPLGLFWGLVGVLYWLPKAFTPFLVSVPTYVHVFVQIYGFLWCFVVGFLGTAVPRFTGTPLLKNWETLIQAVLSLLCMVALVLKPSWAHVIFFLASFLFTVGISARFFRRKNIVPASMACIPFGLLSAVVGGFCMSMVYWGPTLGATKFYLLGKGLLMQSMMLLLLMGVGGFMMRSILHVSAPPGPGNSVESTKPKPRDWVVFSCLGAAVLGSYIFEALVASNYENSSRDLLKSYLIIKAAGTLRVTIVAWFCLSHIQIHRWPRSGKLSAVWLWLGLWLMVIGLFGESAFSESYRLAFRHLTLIGGFAFSIFCISTRVILSHARRPALLSRASIPFTVAMVLMIIALATRFSVAFVPQNAMRHYAYAALMWGAGALVWAFWVLPLSWAVVDEDSA